MRCENCGGTEFDKIDNHYECCVCGFIITNDSFDYSSINLEAIELFENEKFVEGFEYLKDYDYEHNDNLENLLLYYIGKSYEFGKGCLQNPDKAKTFYNKAINNSPIGSNYNLGKCYNFLGLKYAKGEFFNVDNEAAFSLFVKASSYCNSDAKCSLGVFYKNGLVVSRDEHKGFSLIKEAYEEGSQRAIFQLAKCYQYGIGISKNEKEAYSLYEKASLAGDDKAMVMLGQCFYYGKGVEQDYKNAFKWYSKAADLNNSKGQFNLAMCYFKGIGVELNEELGLEWMNKSAANKDEDASAYLKNKLSH